MQSNEPCTPQRAGRALTRGHGVGSARAACRPRSSTRAGIGGPTTRWPGPTWTATARLIISPSTRLAASSHRRTASLRAQVRAPGRCRSQGTAGRTRRLLHAEVEGCAGRWGSRPRRRKRETARERTRRRLRWGSRTGAWVVGGGWWWWRRDVQQRHVLGAFWRRQASILHLAIHLLASLPAATSNGVLHSARTLTHAPTAAPRAILFRRRRPHARVQQAGRPRHQVRRALHFRGAAKSRARAIAHQRDKLHGLWSPAPRSRHPHLPWTANGAPRARACLLTPPWPTTRSAARAHRRR